MEDAVYGGRSELGKRNDVVESVVMIGSVVVLFLLVDCIHAVLYALLLFSALSQNEVDDARLTA